jgi:hypothetical protein
MGWGPLWDQDLEEVPTRTEVLEARCVQNVESVLLHVTAPSYAQEAVRFGGPITYDRNVGGYDVRRRRALDRMKEATA